MTSPTPASPISDDIVRWLTLSADTTVANMARELLALRAGSRVAEADRKLVDKLVAGCETGSRNLSAEMDACRAARAADSPHPGWLGTECPAPSPPEAQACAMPGHAEAVKVADFVASQQFKVGPLESARQDARIDVLDVVAYRAARRPSEAGEALLPCPFCGCIDIRLDQLPGGLHVQCRSCFIMFPAVVRDPVAAWNRRTGPCA